MTEIVEQPAIAIAGIPGGGPSPDGRLIVIEIETLAGQMLALQFPYNLVDRLYLAAGEFAYAAQQMRETGETEPEKATIGASRKVLKANMIQFQLAEDGSFIRMIATGIGGQPLTIELPAQALPDLQKQVAKIQLFLKRMHKEAKKRRG